MPRNELSLPPLALDTKTTGSDKPSAPEGRMARDEVTP